MKLLLVYVDLQQAFDTVLLYNMYNYKAEWKG